ncbi:hypothetical protein DL96DRAFT_1762110 [Flagelloscypha sp. PMI_526]|nr:hypothetical protein DL96DRAFT_1762110 [Flagelloscypha sp. PMI_526]
MADSKYIIVCCDGTGHDGVVDEIPPITTRMWFHYTVRRPSSRHQPPINILRTSHDWPQIVFYQRGVGSDAVFNGEAASGTADLRTLGTTVGEISFASVASECRYLYVASKIREAYVFIAQNYEDGDEIYLFGFSRGAYTARKVAGLIDRIGLLSMQNIGLFFRIWLDLIEGKKLTLPTDSLFPSIKVIGVFETIRFLQPAHLYNDALGIKDTSFLSKVSIGLHALSFHESRSFFAPILWTVPNGKLQPNQVLKQVWFPGDHSDVGGGWNRRELADISFAWMVGELHLLVPNLSFDANRLHSFHQPAPEPWGTSKPHASWIQGYTVDRRSVGLSAESAKDLHSSLLLSPTSFDPPTIITMKTLFPDKYPEPRPLNAFESICKDNWGKPFHTPIRTITIPSDPIPVDAVIAGQDVDGKTLYVAREKIYPGKYNGKLFHYASNGYEIAKWDGSAEILVSQTVRWQSVQGALSGSKLSGADLVRAGSDRDNVMMYIARASVAPDVGQKHPGWVKMGDVAHIGYAGVEKIMQDYDVLVFIS